MTPWPKFALYVTLVWKCYFANCIFWNVNRKLSLSRPVGTGVHRWQVSSTCTRCTYNRLCVFNISKINQTTNYVLNVWNNMCKVMCYSDLPSSEQMNQCVPLAHYLALPARQRTSGLRQRVKHGLGSRLFPMLSSSKAMCPSMGKCRRWWTSGGASLRWFRLQWADKTPLCRSRLAQVRLSHR